MKRLLRHIALGVLLTGVASTAAVGAAVQDDPNLPKVGDDPAKCLNLPDRPDLIVRAYNFKSHEGQVKYVLYGDKAEDFLAKGKRLFKLEVPVKEEGTEVCISLPRTGNFALGAFHDINGNGKVNVPPDGGGFSNNPKIVFSPPSFKKAVFTVGPGVNRIEVEMRYLFR